MRNSIASSRLSASAAARALLFVCAQPGISILYNVIGLGALGGTYSAAMSINGSGQMVGDEYIASKTADHAGFWNDSGSSATYHGTFGGISNRALNINRFRQRLQPSFTGTFRSFAPRSLAATVTRRNCFRLNCVGL